MAMSSHEYIYCDRVQPQHGIFSHGVNFSLGAPRRRKPRQGENIAAEYIVPGVKRKE
jgi:hypothetical protein